MSLCNDVCHLTVFLFLVGTCRSECCPRWRRAPVPRGKPRQGRYSWLRNNGSTSWERRREKKRKENQRQIDLNSHLTNARDCLLKVGHVCVTWERRKPNREEVDLHVVQVWTAERVPHARSVDFTATCTSRFWFWFGSHGVAYAQHASHAILE